jgi:3-polyprenyl-4-hydroxybenzoate decarboxylase
MRTKTNEGYIMTPPLPTYYHTAGTLHLTTFFVGCKVDDIEASFKKSKKYI